MRLVYFLILSLVIGQEHPDMMTSMANFGAAGLTGPRKADQVATATVASLESGGHLICWGIAESIGSGFFASWNPALVKMEKIFF
jgi:hypothetical protein